ncbi:ATP-binding cassette domain-containing protein [Sinorhizobium meliloti]
MNQIYPSRTFQVDVAPTLEIRQLDKSFTVAGRELKVLASVDLSVKSGEFVTIVGASGCGKSTLLRLILGLDLDYNGDIVVHGAPVRRPGLDRSIVFQDHRLLPWLTSRGKCRSCVAKQPVITGREAGDGARAYRARWPDTVYESLPGTAVSWNGPACCHC